MKDIAHHMSKFVGKVKPEISETEAEALLRKNIHVDESKDEKRKKEKRCMRKDRIEHIPSHKSDEERNREQKHNCPIHKPNVKSNG